MDDQKLAAAVAAYITAAYTAMGRDAPADVDFGFGVCLHWAAAGKVMPLSEWLTAMCGNQTPPVSQWPADEPEYQTVRKELDFDFKLIRNGKIVRIIGGNSWAIA